jgi:UPF0755 protein
LLNHRIYWNSDIVTRFLRISFALLAVGVAAAAWAAFDFYRYANTPAGANHTPVVFSISQGEPFPALIERLQHAKIITDVRRFKLLARFRGDDKHLKAGEYQLATDMTPVRVLQTLISGKTVLHSLKIPEGYTVAQIAAEAERMGLAATDRFLSLANDPQTAESFGLEAQTLEGYLFPDTYHFPGNAGETAIIKKMVTHFQEQLPQEWIERAAQLKLSIHEVIILASIIEKETGDPSERPLIASVFHNRLKKKMRLESDPTVIYGIKNFDGNLTRRHLRTQTPYNTYAIRGLPAGPIANPGLSAIKAALYPAQTDYLFFVSKGDGTHFFSSNLKDHNKAVRRYQLRGR